MIHDLTNSLFFLFILVVMATKNILNGECVNKIVSSSMDNRLILYNLTTKTTNTIQHYSKQVNHVR